MNEHTMVRDAREMLAQFDAGPVSILQYVAFGARPHVPARGGRRRIAADDVLAAIDRLGFRLLGRYRTPGVVPFVRSTRERYVDPLGIVVVSARRGIPHGPLELGVSKYNLTTFFDDGSCIVTYARLEPPVPSTELAIERGGAAVLDVDYPSHLEAVRAHRARPLVVGDLETSLALESYYDRRLRPSNAAMFLFMRLLLVITIARLAWSFLHHHGRH